MLDSWSGEFYRKYFLFQYLQHDLNKLHREFTFWQLVVLQKTVVTMEKSKKIKKKPHNFHLTMGNECKKYLSTGILKFIVAV